MAEHGGKAPPKKGGADKKSGGGFWGFVNDLVSNLSVNVSVGKPGRPGATSRNPTDPSERMEPVREDRQEAYEETVFRKTEGEQGTAPAVRVDRDRKSIARSLDQRTRGAAETQIPQAGGSPLAPAVKKRMEPKLGADLSGVRVHTSGESAEAAETLNAKAFTVGNDVHFGSGNYAPGSKEGDRLLAHELTHVVQGSRSGVQRKPDDGGDGEGDGAAGVSKPGEPAEQEADAVADHVADQLHEGGDDQEHGAHASGDAGGQGGGGATDKQSKSDKKETGKANGNGDKNADKNARGGDGGSPADSKQAKGGDGKSKEGAGGKPDAAGGGAGAKQDAHGSGGGKSDGGKSDAQGGGGGKSDASGGAAGKPAAESGGKQAGASSGGGGEGGAAGGGGGQSGGGAAPSGGGHAGGAKAEGGSAPQTKQAAPAIATKKRNIELAPKPITAELKTAGRKIHRAPKPAPAAAPKKPPGGAPAAAAAGPAGAGAAPAAPPVPTALAGALPAVQDVSPELGIDMLQMQGDRSFGAGGDPATVAKQVKAKGGHQDGTVLTMPAVPAATVSGAQSVEAAANAIMAATGLQKVNVSKQGDDVSFTPQLNPTGPSVNAQNKAWPAFASMTGWFKEGDVKIRGAGAYIRYWKGVPASDARKLLADNRGNFRKLSDGPYVENPDDKKDAESAVHDRMQTATAAWKKDLDDDGQLLSDKKTAGPTSPKEKILKGFSPTAAFTFAEDKAKEKLLAELPNLAKAGAAYQPVTKGVVEGAIKEGGAQQRPILLDGGTKVAADAKTHATGQVTHPALVDKVNTINYDANTDTFGVVRIPKQVDIDGHHYYAPRDVKRTPKAPGVFPDGTYKITYLGYRDAEFTVTVGKNGMPTNVVGKKLSLAAGMPRGVVRDTPGLTGPPPVAPGAGAGPGAAGAAAPGTTPGKPAGAGVAGPAAAGSGTPATGAAGSTPKPGGAGPAPGAAGSKPAAATAGKPPAVAGATTPAVVLTPEQVLARAHLIGDQFRGSGYKEALNLVTTSEKYNHPIMSTVENRLADKIAKHLPDIETTFDYEVKVEWAEGPDANAMIMDIISAGQANGLIIAGSPEEADVKAGLQRFMGAVENRKVVKGVKYLATGPTKSGGNFSEPDEVGPDIYFT